MRIKNLNIRMTLLPMLALILAVIAFLALNGSMARAEAPATCGTDTVVTLFAGQTIDAGIVTVGNDEDFLYVTSARPTAGY